MDRTRTLPLLGAILAAALTSASPALQIDRPGEEVTETGRTPEALKSLLPPFTSAPLRGFPAEEGWSTPLLSPTGRCLLAGRRTEEGRTVYLLDREGSPKLDLTSTRSTHAAAVWSASDRFVLLELRSGPGSRPEYRKLDHAAEREFPAGVAGLPRWSPSGADYYLRAAGGFRRFTASGAPVGSSLGAAEPSWSRDGRALASLTERPGSTLREVRIVPARGTTPTVLVSAAGWAALRRNRGWRTARGPERVFWSPAGDALYGVLKVRPAADPSAPETGYLIRIDLNRAKRDGLVMDPTGALLSASADCRHWILRLGGVLHRVSFTPPRPATGVRHMLAGAAAR